MSAGKEKRKKKTMWVKEEVELLLDLWEEKLPQLRGNKRNSHVFADMAVEMSGWGFLYTALEIKNKIHNLTNKYRDEKKAVGPSGGCPSSWEFYVKINHILGGYKSLSLESVVEESIVETIEILDEEGYESFSQSKKDAEEEYSTVECHPEPAKKRFKKKENSSFQNKFLEEFRAANETIAAEMKELIEDGRESLQIERERNAILEQFLELLKQNKP